MNVFQGEGGVVDELFFVKKLGYGGGDLTLNKKCTK